MSEKVVKMFMLLCVVLLCGFGYLYITADLGVAEGILDNSTGNSSFQGGQALLEGSDTMSTAILIFVVILFAIMIILALKHNGWL